MASVFSPSISEHQRTSLVTKVSQAVLSKRKASVHYWQDKDCVASMQLSLTLERMIACQDEDFYLSKHRLRIPEGWGDGLVDGSPRCRNTEDMITNPRTQRKSEYLKALCPCEGMGSSHGRMPRGLRAIRTGLTLTVENNTVSRKGEGKNYYPRLVLLSPSYYDMYTSVSHT